MEQHLFEVIGPDGSHSDEHLLAKMVAIIGPPPARFLLKSSRSLRYWDSSRKVSLAQMLPFTSN